VEKVAGYIGRSRECQMLANTPITFEMKWEYLKLAQAWLDLVMERRAFLIETGQYSPD
jgi:hypothetical protein